jgi:NAD(P)-dependent dehydrogenase (short-subunit alcohol dehydrogenase family)
VAAVVFATGKNVLITGGGKGIGLACARAFRAEGAHVAIVLRSQANLDANCKALGNVQTFAADLMLATAGLANAYAARGVRVVGLNPGLTSTDRVAEGLKVEARRAGISEKDTLSRAVAKLPLDRLAEPGEIADVVVFAASERGRYLIGANITMDGASSPTVV